MHDELIINKLPLSVKIGREWRRCLKRLGLQNRRARKAFQESPLLPADLEAILKDPLESETQLSKHYGTTSSPEPEVSVVIAAFNHIEHTVQTLLALAWLPDAASREVILVDDHSSDRTQELCSKVPGIRYLRNAHNLGFGPSCNLGAEKARGKVLWFLNNDTLPLAGSLDALLAGLQADPTAGLVGSMLIFPDGRTQEAGSSLRADGGAKCRGWGSLPMAPDCAYSTHPAYCSAASVLIRRELFLELGGFDPAYAPAYYEDTDLAMKVLQLGLHTLYQPTSRVVHKGGITCGTDEKHGIKTRQVINQAIFYAKWNTVLKRSFPSFFPRGSSEMRRQPEALVLDEKVPTPDRDSGSVDMINTLRILLELGYKVTFATPDMRYDPHYTPPLQAMGIRCLYGFDGAGLSSHLKAAGATLDLAILARPKLGRDWLRKVRKSAPGARIIYDTVDLHFFRMEREAALNGRRSTSRKAERYRRMEYRNMAEADATLLRSSVELDLVHATLPGALTCLFPLTREVPPLTPPGPENRQGLLFVGNYHHTPNRDAVAYFLSEVWPGIRLRAPGETLTIVGTDWPADTIPPEQEGVQLLGYVENLDPIYERARVAIAPLRFGAGLKGKVVDAMMHGIPCVTTPTGAEGLQAVEGQDLLVSSSPEAMVAQVLTLLQDDRLWQELSTNGRRLSSQQFSIQANTLRIASLFRHLGLPPFWGECPYCGHRGPFKVPIKGEWKSEPLCPSCGAPPALRTAAWLILREVAPEMPGPLLERLKSAPGQLLLLGYPPLKSPLSSPRPSSLLKGVLYYDPAGLDRLDAGAIAGIWSTLEPGARMALVLPYSAAEPATHQPPEGTRYGRDFLGSLSRAGLEAQAFATPVPGIGSMEPMVIIIWRKDDLRPTR